MADVVSPEVRSRMMSGIRGKNTRPELMLRKALHARGFRFRIHAAVPGKPDMIFPRRRAVLFVHGCFWHAHHCHLFKWPSTRQEFWRAKIEGNAVRDAANTRKLEEEGWRVGVVWECALKGRTRLDFAEAIKRCSEWLESDAGLFELSGEEKCTAECLPIISRELPSSD